MTCPLLHYILLSIRPTHSDPKTKAQSIVKIILTGGGTGGHVYPAIAIAEELKERHPEANFLYIGVRGRAEEKIVPALGYNIKYVAARGIAGTRNPLSLAFGALKILIGLIQALVYTAGFAPDIVIGTGGFASVPAITAALILKKLGLSRTRIFIHEQNFAPGKWNRIIARWVDRVWISFEGSETFFKGSKYEMAGYPVRRQIHPGERKAARKELTLPEDARVVFVFGGSQGARSINRALVDALPEILADNNVYVVHGCGALKSAEYDSVEDTKERLALLNLPEEKLKRYFLKDYFLDIEKYYAAADLVICRGGAGTISEVCRCSRASIIIPKSGLSGEHQIVNAFSLARRGASEIIFEVPVRENGVTNRVVSPAELARKVVEIISSPGRIAEMETRASAINTGDAATICVDSINAVLGGRQTYSSFGSSATPGDHESLHLAFMSGERVVNFARRVARTSTEQSREDELLHSIVRYFASSYIYSPSWPQRNAGVKIAGILRCLELRDRLIELVADRKPARLSKRILGGDFSEVGFIRRNALNSLSEIGIWDDKLEKLLVKVLSDDSYFETRVSAARLIINLQNFIGENGELTGLLQANLKHRSPEVCWNCLEAMGAISPSPTLFLDGDRIERYLYHENWKIRQALLKATGHLLDRNMIRFDDRIFEQLEQLIPTCTDFTPTFPLKRSLNQIYSKKEMIRELEKGSSTGKTGNN